MHIAFSINVYRYLTVFLFTAISLPSSCLCQISYPDLIVAADNQFSDVNKVNGQIPTANIIEASRLYKSAFERKHRNRPLTDIYNYMDCEATLGHNENAFKLLKELLQRGFYKITLERDSTFDHMRNDRRWEKVAVLINKNKLLARSKYNRLLRSNLEDIFSTDQFYRNELLRLQQQLNGDTSLWVSVSDSIMKYDSINIKKVINIIENHGWPGRDAVGDWGNDVMFLVIQHADINIQEKYLPLIKHSVKKGKSPPAHVAYLTDRILINNGKKQLYGTQTAMDATTGKYIILHVRYPKKLEEMREKMGIISSEAYLKILNN